MVDKDKPDSKLNLTKIKDANEHCPGVKSETAGKSESCEGCPNQSICASGEAKKEDPSKS